MIECNLPGPKNIKNIYKKEYKRDNLTGLGWYYQAKIIPPGHSHVFWISSGAGMPACQTTKPCLLNLFRCWPACRMSFMSSESHPARACWYAGSRHQVPECGNWWQFGARCNVEGMAMTSGIAACQGRARSEGMAVTSGISTCQRRTRLRRHGSEVRHTLDKS